MSRMPDSEKFDENGNLCVIDDNIPTPEEIRESLKNVPAEQLEEWDKIHSEIARRLGIDLK